jgi:alpha amylase-like protein
MSYKQGHTLCVPYCFVMCETLKDFDRLESEEVKRRGIRIIMDFVMNHSADQQFGSMSRDPAFCAPGGPSRSGLLLFVCCRPLRPQREDRVVSCDSIPRAAKDTIKIRSPGVRDPGEYVVVL